MAVICPTLCNIPSTNTWLSARVFPFMLLNYVFINYYNYIYRFHATSEDGLIV